jgi:hypothetical protein
MWGEFLLASRAVAAHQTKLSQKKKEIQQKIVQT